MAKKKIEVERTKTKNLGVFFHELYAFGYPWRSSFWLSPMQRHIARRLVEYSDFWITNREGSAQWLRRFAGKKPHAVLPVFSNVGEMKVYSAHRLPKIVVFGSAALRCLTYRAGGKVFLKWTRDQGIELHDIGPVINDPEISESLRRVGAVVHGRLESGEVSKQLANASFGILAYPVDYVAKSGVFAAYCAHGVCPLLISNRHYEPVDGLVANKHYLPLMQRALLFQSDIFSIGETAWDWYQPHRMSAHAEVIQELTR